MDIAEVAKRGACLTTLRFHEKKELIASVSRGLRHAIACPAPSHAGCPGFQKLLKAAASGVIEKRWRTTELRLSRK
jgi:hypothetical protein